MLEQFGKRVMSRSADPAAKQELHLELGTAIVAAKFWERALAGKQRPLAVGTAPAAPLLVLRSLWRS